MIFRWGGHTYETGIRYAIKTRLSKWFGLYENPETMWISHADDCCDYWQTMTIDDLRKDDGFKVKEPKS